jgi:flagellar biosynthesis/type III secretory pathway M-ring protein FliF/YscJ
MQKAVAVIAIAAVVAVAVVLGLRSVNTEGSPLDPVKRVPPS